jgi:type IV pilus assembly protein PilA
MLTSIKQRMDREDEGFTLIELMVVLLIIAILLAIAIPTFLGARNTANARSGQENLRNMLTAEQSYWTSNQSFDNTAAGVGALEPSLTVTTGTLAATAKGTNKVSISIWTETASAGTISTWAAGSSTTADGVTLVGFAKDNNCYAIYQSDNSSADFTAYTEWNDSSGTCVQPASTALPASAPPQSGGNAASHVGATAGAGWYSSF